MEDANCLPALYQVNASPAACIPVAENQPGGSRIFWATIRCRTSRPWARAYANYQTVTRRRRRTQLTGLRALQPQLWSAASAGPWWIWWWWRTRWRRWRGRCAGRPAESERSASTASKHRGELCLFALCGQQPELFAAAWGPQRVRWLQLLERVYGRLRTPEQYGDARLERNRSHASGLNYFTNGLVNPATEAGNLCRRDRRFYSQPVLLRCAFGRPYQLQRAE